MPARKQISYLKMMRAIKIEGIVVELEVGILKEVR